MRALLLFGVCLLLSGCSVGLGQLPIGRTADGDDYVVTAHFVRADRIRPGTEGRMGQQLLGRVHDLSTDGRSAQVRLSLSQSIELPATVTAAIELPSALGEPYVKLSAPSPIPTDAILADGDVIEDTEIGPELESSLAALGLVLNGSGFDQLESIMTEMNAAFGGRGPDIRELLLRTDRIMAAAAAHRADVDRVLTAAGSVSRALADNRERLNEGLTVAAPTMELLVRQRDHIASLVERSASLAATAEDVFAGHEDQLVSGVDQLTQIIESIRGFNESVTPALDNMNGFIDGFTGAVHGDYLVFDGALDLPETIAELMTGGRLADVPSTLQQQQLPTGAGE